MMTWYVTVGYPGGEFASGDAGMLVSAVLGGPESDDADITNDGSIAHEGVAGSMEANWYVRACPPDLVEWLDFPGMWDAEPQFHGAHSRRKVPGGWVLVDGAGDSAALTFIPVAGAANLTVLEARDEV